MLKISALHAYYGPIEALHGVGIEVDNGVICCIIGANGAGKTTLLKSVTGVIKRTGSIMWNGEELSLAKPAVVNKKGIIHVPEGRLVFPGLSVRHNLEVGAISWHGFFGKKSFAEDLEKVYELFPRLGERKNQLAWSLSGGEQQMLAIGRGLMARPRLLMLDEPSMGLAPLLVEEVFKKIVEINRMGISVLLVEQNASLALEVSAYAYILEQGAVKFSGKSEDMRHDPRILAAYLGNFAKKEN
jgi:branched-chain amino acid transport system ATP-binding protein